jgi:hypothetical protein
MKKTIFLTICTFLSLGFALSQEDPLEFLKKKYAQYLSAYKRAKLDIFFNQPSYAKGDTAFFRAYYLNASDLSFKTGQEIIHLRVFDNRGKEILANELLVRDGFAKAKLAFPNDLLPGLYLIVAYSDWMKNMDKSLFFKREVMLIDRKKLKEHNEDNSTIEIYPEGGNLIEGIENNVLFRLKNSEFFGKLIIKNFQGDTIATSALDTHGVAEIKVKPEIGKKYAVEYILNGSLVTKSSLPSPRSEGFSMRVLTDDNFEPSNLIVTASRGIDLKEEYYALLTNSSRIIFSTPLIFDNNSNSNNISLPKKLPRGVYQLCILNKAFSIQAERVIFVGDQSELDIGIEMLNFYKTRETANVKVSIQDNNEIAKDARFSVRVFDGDILKGTDGNIITNLMLSSDVPLPPEAMKIGSQDRLNTYLITQKCNWINWENIVKDSKPVFRPTNHQTFSGKAYSSIQSSPIKDSTLLRFFLKKEILGYEGYVKEGGYFRVPLQYSLFGNQDVFYSASFKGLDVNDVAIKLDTDSLYSFRSRLAKELDEQDPYGSHIHRKRVIDRSFGFYSAKDASRNLRVNPNDLFEEELGGADITVRLKDYVVFPTMSELIREVVRSVEHRKIKNRDVIRIYTTQKRPNNFSQPLFIINGNLTKNTNIFLGLNPEEVLTLKIIKDSNKLTRFGSLGENGIILVETRNLSWEKAKEKNTFYFTGLTDTTNENSIKKCPSSTPDLRACLYWNPDLRVNARGQSFFQFQTSDHTGNFVIQVQGITENGTPFFKEKHFSVSYKN